MDFCPEPRIPAPAVHWTPLSPRHLEQGVQTRASAVFAAWPLHLWRQCRLPLSPWSKTALTSTLPVPRPRNSQIHPLPRTRPPLSLPLAAGQRTDGFSQNTHRTASPCSGSQRLTRFSGRSLDFQHGLWAPPQPTSSLASPLHIHPEATILGESPPFALCGGTGSYAPACSS